MRHPIRFFLAVCITALLVLYPLAAAAQTSPRIRVFDREVKINFDNGTKRSPTFATLVAHLNEASVLLFVDCDLQLPSRVGARSRLFASINGTRYVRIDMNCLLGERQQISLLAHEFQHALEIASRSDIVDSDSMESFYEDEGFPTYYDGNHKGYETEAAIAVQHRVNAELSGRDPGGRGPETPSYE